MDPRVGTTIAGYRIDAVLGHGGMSVVYLAEQVRLGRKVALKILGSGLSADAVFRERFEREARQAAEIDHPNIVPVYDAGEAEGQLYIAMRLIEGRDLGALIEAEGSIGMGRSLFVLEQAAAALDAAHARGLVHRDVKPENILIEDSSERVFVTDFGIAKRAASPGLTRTGFFLGTVDYAAPEQLSGAEVDARTDVYAMGCVLYECLIGRPPFERDNEVAVMHAHLSEPPPALTSARSELPESLDRVLVKAMAKAKEERYGSCGELIAAVRAVALGGIPTTDHRSARSLAKPSEPAPRRAVADRLRGKTVWLAAILATAVAAAAVAVTTLVLGGGERGETSTISTAGPDGVAPIENYIPAGLLPACKESAVYAGATATVVCLPPRGSGSFFPDKVTISLFPGGDVYTPYTTEANAHGFDPLTKTGRCDDGRWRGTGTWVHGPNSPGGSRFCYLTDGNAVLFWTHEASGEPDHENIFAFARAPQSKRAELLAWWSYWRHRIGRVTF